MLFNSTAFAVFLPLVFLLYWLPPLQTKFRRNLLLLAASYVFYAWWDWRFLGLLVLSSGVDYWAGARISESLDQNRRRFFLWCSLGVNLGVLGFFKYYDFFIESFAAFLESMGISAHPHTLRLVLPVGISFYTFQSLSYTIDIYRRQTAPAESWLDFFAYVSFFPQLVAGPIERAGRLLPQFQSVRKFDWEDAADGLRRILWGLFKKMVIADNLAPRVDLIFNSHESLDGSRLLIGAVLFAFQIYCDFSGYSQIALGTAKLFGFNLMRNFRTPYFSRNPAEFWRRWHISLSTWFRDYVYIPLGGNRGSRLRRAGNILATFGLSGLWHGANWTFICWGLAHALLYLPKIFLRGVFPSKPEASLKLLPGPVQALKIGGTFFAVVLAWVLFRARDMSQAAAIYQRMLFDFWQPSMLPGAYFRTELAVCLGLCAWEWLQRGKNHCLDIGGWPRVWRWAAYYVLIILILWKGNLHHVPFIYFQF